MAKKQKDWAETVTVKEFDQTMKEIRQRVKKMEKEEFNAIVQLTAIRALLSCDRMWLTVNRDQRGKAKRK